MKLFFILSLLILSACGPAIGTKGSSTLPDLGEVCFGLSGNYVSATKDSNGDPVDATLNMDTYQYCHLAVTGCNFASIHSWNANTDEAIIAGWVPPISSQAYCPNTAPLQTCQLNKISATEFTLDCGGGSVDFHRSN